MAIISVAVFCGSHSGNDPLHIEHAVQLGHILAEKNITLVYGGSSKGIMGAVANATLEKKGKVIGVMPKVLVDWEHQHKGLTELHEVADMHVRKSMMYAKCDAGIILAGGYGTLDELFEMLTWNQLSIHDKRLIIVNTGGFYDHLIAHLKKMEGEGFLYAPVSNRITIVDSPSAILF